MKEQVNSALNLDQYTQRRLVSRVLRVTIPILFLLTLTGVLNNLFGEFHLSRFVLNAIGIIALITSWIFFKRERLVESVNLILYGALALFGISVVLNGGVRTPNYVGFLSICVLASTFSSTRLIWGSYLSFMILGAISFLYPLYDPAEITFPPEHRYYTIYGVIGLLVTIALVYTRESFNDMVQHLAERESLLSSVFESISDPLLIVDDHGEVTYYNKSAQRFNEQIKTGLGHSLIELVFFEMTSKEERSLKSLINECSDETKTFKVHLSLGRNTTWYSISISPYSSALVRSGSVIVLRDIAEQQRLSQNQKMSAVGRLANGIAHDFNNMLGAIKSANDLLMLDLEEEHQELLEMIDEATERSANLIKQLRLFSKRGDSDESVILLNELILDVKTLLSSVTQHSHEVKVEVCDHPVLIRGVREQLHSTLMNLGLNGLQAMNERGVLTFRLGIKSLSFTEARLLSPELVAGDLITIEVQDEGLGIAPDLQEKIFEPFFTTRDRSEGSGLGLSMVHGAVQRHRGAVEVWSQVGMGTTMKLYFPQDKELTLEKAKVAEVLNDVKLIGLRVLVIDDEVLIRQSLAAMLENLGLVVSVASSGEEALAIVQDSSRPPQELVILDMLMPGMNGHEVFLELQAVAPQLPVILSSGYYPEQPLEEMRKRGLAGELHKPYGLEKVKTVIARVVAKQS